MKNKIKSPTKSNSRSSQKNQTHTQSKETLNSQKTIENILDKPDEEALFWGVLDTGLYLSNRIRFSGNQILTIEAYLNSFVKLLSREFTFNINSKWQLQYYVDRPEGIEVSNETLIILNLARFACFKLNLQAFEDEDSDFKGLNNYLRETFPEPYSSYCAISEKFGFKTGVFDYEKLEEEYNISAFTVDRDLEDFEVINIEELTDNFINYIEKETSIRFDQNSVKIEFGLPSIFSIKFSPAFLFPEERRKTSDGNLELFIYIHLESWDCQKIEKLKIVYSDVNSNEETAFMLFDIMKKVIPNVPIGLAKIPKG